MNEKSRQMDELLRAAGLAPKETHCYGSQVVVTVRSREMFTLRGITESVRARLRLHTGHLPGHETAKRAC